LVWEEKRREEKENCEKKDDGSSFNTYDCLTSLILICQKKKTSLILNYEKKIEERRNFFKICF
jgi:hypothetical protein